jgi:hypothetical protein
MPATETPQGEAPERDGPALRRDMLAAVGVVVALVALVAGKQLRRVLAPHPSEAQCGQLLDRYLEQASVQRSPRADEGDIAVAQKKAREAPAYLADVAACRSRLTAAQVECGLSSPNVDDMERCLQ